MPLLRRAYYGLKPHIPWRWRLAVRRQIARYQRGKHTRTWPIDERAAIPPANWPGWPDGKKFAVVLTHDVEGQVGLDRVRKLAALEESLGFRSSFNFVPEGEYRVSAELRNELTARGFEVGIHGLHHDGRLYNSREVFRQRAQRINQYMKEWGAVGFRSPFMHHNLDWIHDLDIAYDASTFDTDPFEPQPDGVGTIFPFWVPGRKQGGYVELPYTLPQDSTLFVLFRGEADAVWRQKLDWVIQHGGMVLINTHPDYMAFGSGEFNFAEYDESHYTKLLNYIRSLEGQFWPALPKDVATFVRPLELPRARSGPRRVCMLSYSFYETDNRVMRYAETLARAGDHVDAIALKLAPELPDQETIDGVHLHRAQLRRRDERGKFSYLFRILRFLLKSAVILSRRHRQAPYDLIHVHNVPDFLVFAAWLPKLRGARVLLDIHDLMPDFYLSKFGTQRGGMTFRALCGVERASARVADHVIISNDLWFDTITGRSVSTDTCSVVLNHVDLTIFHPRDRQRADHKLQVVFPGGLQWHQGLDVAIRAFKLLKPRLPQAEFHIYGDGQARPQLEALIRDENLSDSVFIHGECSIRQVADILANSDLGVVPKRADSFGNEAYSTKIMEFMSQGVPVVLSRTKIDSFYFKNGVVKFFESGNHQAMADAMFEVLSHPELRQKMIQEGLEYVRKNNWDVKKGEYLRLVDSLTA